jgi:hypothetical protein
MCVCGEDEGAWQQWGMVKLIFQKSVVGMSKSLNGENSSCRKSGNEHQKSVRSVRGV